MNARIGCFLKTWLVPAATVLYTGQTISAESQPYRAAPGAVIPSRPLSAAQRSAMQRDLDALYLRDGRSTPPRSLPAAVAEAEPGPIEVNDDDVVVQQVNGTEAAPLPAAVPIAPETEVQRQLRALYMKDGREMPEMNLSEMPVEYPTAAQYGPVQPALPEGPQAPPKQPSFLKRLFSFSKKPPAPPPVKKPAPQLAAPNKPGMQTPPLAQPRTVQPRVRTATAAPRVPSNAYPPPVAPPRQLPQPVAPPVADARPVAPVPPDESIPRLDVEPAVSAAEPAKASAAPETPASTATASLTPTQPGNPAAEGSPFSGLKLQTPDEGLPTLKPVPSVDFDHPLAESENAEPPADQRDKFRMLAAAPGKTGFKGFCPVMLKNHRELVLAKEEFHSEYQGQKFIFSSAEAKAEFDKSPAEFAPAGHGLDVVMLLDEDEKVEGSLDHAAWFQGRLYLFSNAENLSAFVTAPQDFTDTVDESFEELAAPPATVKKPGVNEPIPELKSEEELENGPQFTPATTDKKSAAAPNPLPSKTTTAVTPAAGAKTAAPPGAKVVPAKAATPVPPAKPSTPVSKDDAGAKPAGNTKPAATPKAAPKAAPAPKAALPAAKQTITKTAMATTTVRAK